jgi:tetratricopeptide (TPR) repeat protein
LTAWPGFRARQLDAAARRALAKGELTGAEASLRAAAAADPRAVEPWTGLSELHYALWQRDQSPTRWRQFDEASGRMLALDPHSAPAWSQVGLWQLAAFRRTGQEQRLADAVTAFRRAVELFPNRALGHARLAWALHTSGDEAEAAREAARALELDDQNPHQEQKLSRQALEDVRLPAGEMARETMLRLAGPPEPGGVPPN